MQEKYATADAMAKMQGQRRSLHQLRHLHYVCCMHCIQTHQEPRETFLRGPSGEKIFLNFVFLKWHILMYFKFLSNGVALKHCWTRGNLPPLILFLMGLIAFDGNSALVL